MTTTSDFLTRMLASIKDAVDDVLAWEDLADPEGVLQVAPASVERLDKMAPFCRSRELTRAMNKARHEIQRARSAARRALERTNRKRAA